MQILNPVAWFLILLVVPLLAIFLIKAGYRRQTVSTMLFWDDVCGTTRLALWGTRLRGVFSFVVAAVFVALMITAILNPVSTRNLASESRQVQTTSETENPITMTRCEVRRHVLDPTEYELMIEAVNLGSRQVTTSLTIERDGMPIHCSRWELVPNKPQMKFIRGVSETDAVLRAELKHNLYASDGGTKVNVAETLLPACGRVKVLCRNVSDMFLLKALRAMPLVSVEMVALLPKRLPADTLVVIQGELPLQLPEGNVLIIEPKGRCELFSAGDVIAAPVVGNVVDTALTRFISLVDTHLPGATKIIPSESGPAPETLISTKDGHPLLLQWKREVGRVILFAAQPGQGEFVFRPSFPLLIANIVNVCRSETDNADAVRFASSQVERLAEVRERKFRSGSEASQPLWFYFGWFALVVSIVEYLFYHRRIIE